MLFSILIPVYNVEQYLRQCLDSVLTQGFRDFEVILVNDGSTDSSGSICREYAQRDGRIKYFEKKNEGLLQTRRYSIKRASGEYILFLDSDDFWDPGILSALHAEICKRDVDMICYRFRIVSDQGKRKHEDRGIFPDRTLFTAGNKERFIKELVSSSRLNMMWTKCVRRTIIDVDADYSGFGDKRGEDFLQSVPLIRNASTILYLDDVFVNYRMSVSGRGRNFRLRYFDDYEVVRTAVFENLKQMNVSDETMQCFFTRYIDGLMGFMDSFVWVIDSYQSFRENCSHFRGFPLFKEAEKRVSPSSIRSIKHRLDYMMLEKNQYYLLYHMHKMKNNLKEILGLKVYIKAHYSKKRSAVFQKKCPERADICRHCLCRKPSGETDRGGKLL